MAEEKMTRELVQWLCEQYINSHGIGGGDFTGLCTIICGNWDTGTDVYINCGSWD